MKVKVKVIHKTNKVRTCPTCGRRIHRIPRNAVLVQREIVFISVEKNAA